MLAQIEAAVAARLTLKVSEPKHVDVEEKHGALALPAIEVYAAGGPFTKIGQRYKLKPSIFVVVTFQDMRSVKDRRAGMYPVLEAVVSALMQQTLGLSIDPLTPKEIANITLEEEEDEGKIVFAAEFETGFIIDKIDDDAAAAEDLLEMGFKYYLKPGDDVADAEDVVEFGSET
jgi:hypothetical protein